MSSLDSVRDDFNADLERARRLLGLVRQFRTLGSSPVPDAIATGEPPWEQAVDLAGLTTSLRTDLPVLSGSLLLYICGRFEYFVRQLVVCLADIAIADADKYEDISMRVRKELRFWTLAVAASPGKYGFDDGEANQFLIDLSAALDAPADPPKNLPTQLLGITESNMRAEVLVSTLKRVEISDAWAELAKQAPLRTHLGSTSDADCRKAACSRLDDVMSQRNAVAHPTATTVFPGPEQVSEVLDFFQVLANVLTDVAKLPRA